MSAAGQLTAMDDRLQPPPARMLARAATLRCPNCGGIGVLQTWLRPRPACPTCGLKLDRGEHDHWLGAYTVNLVVAEGIVAVLVLCVLVLTMPDVPWSLLQWGGISLMIAAPFVFYPFSRLIWLAADLVFRPATATDFQPRDG